MAIAWIFLLHAIRASACAKASAAPEKLYFHTRKSEPSTKNARIATSTFVLMLSDGVCELTFDWGAALSNALLLKVVFGISNFPDDAVIEL